MSNIYLPAAASCGECGFTTADIHLLANHPCNIQSFGGSCEDWPCCGHEAGDCNGLLYGSDEAIKADPHILCVHEDGICEIEDYDEYDEEDY